LSRDPSLAFRAGASMHVSSFGMYGFAILSSADFRKTMSFCERYHVLATPLVMLRFREEHGLGIWSIDPIADTPVNDPLYRFIVEMQMGIILSVLRDVMGNSFSPKELRSPILGKTTLNPRNNSENARSSSIDGSMSSYLMQRGSTPAQSLATGQPTRSSNRSAMG
jgi:Arabinose-binding domain of AraC transcription regulator, N-term